MDRKCPTCGSSLLAECLTSNPPWYRDICLCCGYATPMRREPAAALSTDSSEPEQRSPGPKIIKPGKSQFTMVCSRCGCEFMYSLRDLDCVDFVYCPECHERHKHPNQASSGSPDWWPYVVQKSLQDSIDPYTGQFRKTTDLPRVSEDYAGPKGTTTANMDYAPNQMSTTNSTKESDHAAKD